MNDSVGMEPTDDMYKETMTGAMGQKGGMRRRRAKSGRNGMRNKSNNKSRVGMRKSKGRKGMRKTMRKTMRRKPRRRMYGGYDGKDLI